MDAVIFKDLPATFPERDKYKKPSIAGSLIFHVILILAVLIIPLLLPQSISERQLLITLITPIGPPPPPAAPPVQVVAVPAPPVTKPQVIPVVTPPVLVTPVAIPKDVARIVEEPIAPAIGVIGGVPGGIPRGMPGGVLGGILASNANANLVRELPPPPPPPPPPKMTAPATPIRVGGDVKEPRPIKMVPPIYPALASRARVSGVVILEATLTAQGTVEEIRVISGHPLLIEAAIACVKQWQYEPTLLNGSPVAVILTAKVHFERAPISD
jgi:protein TonB